MSKIEKLFDRLLRGETDSKINFDELCHLLVRLGFSEKIPSSHHIFHREGVDEIINIQPKGSKAKSYQVRQILGLVFKYRLRVKDE